MCLLLWHDSERKLTRMVHGPLQKCWCQRRAQSAHVYAAVRTAAQRLELDVAAEGVVLDTADWKELHSEEQLEQRLTHQVLEPKRNCTDHIAVAVPSAVVAVVAVAAGQPGLALGVDASKSVTHVLCILAGSARSDKF